jgi:hypothetical protein
MDFLKSLMNSGDDMNTRLVNAGRKIANTEVSDSPTVLSILRDLARDLEGHIEPESLVAQVLRFAALGTPTLGAVLANIATSIRKHATDEGTLSRLMMKLTAPRMMTG